jgi:probable H4MPT-linked C1 transfer pathway protein
LPPADDVIAGWDIGGAHVKLAIVAGGAARGLREASNAEPAAELIAVGQWPCPLWQGLDRLQAVLAEAQSCWPQLARARHAVTMTGEMVDLFEHREAGVLMLAELLAATLGDDLVFWAGGPGPQAWCEGDSLGARWAAVASANWAATATLAARRLADVTISAAVLVDIGSTTTDLIALRGGEPQAQGRSDADRLASGELLYQGVVRTPLCALAPRIAHRGRRVNVMNEFFATTADVHRLLGDLAPDHDQQPAADGGGKDLPATRRRLARMVGLDARDASDADWVALAAAWRAAQLAALRENLERVAAAAGLADDAPIVAAGCGDFMAFELARAMGRQAIRFDALVTEAATSIDAGSLRHGLQVGAPAVAVAVLQAAARADAARAVRRPGLVEARRCGS